MTVWGRGGVVALHLDAATLGKPFETKDDVLAFAEPIILRQRETIIACGSREYHLNMRIRELHKEKLALEHEIKDLIRSQKAIL